MPPTGSDVWGTYSSSNANHVFMPLLPLQLLIWRNANLVREAATGSTAAAAAPAAEPCGEVWFMEAAGGQGDGLNSACIPQLQLRRAQLQALLLQQQQQQAETATQSGDGGGHDGPTSAAGNPRAQQRQQAHQQQVEAFIRGGNIGRCDGGNSAAQ